MKRRSFFASLVAGLGTLAFPFGVAAAKKKVEPFQDWYCSVKLPNGKVIKRTLHLAPRSSPPFEMRHDGMTFAIVSSDLKKRTSLYRYSPSLDERVANYLKEHDKFKNLPAEPDTASAHMFVGENSLINYPMTTREVKNGYVSKDLVSF